MAKLVYDETGRLLFTKEMKEEYTILMPQMLPIHFGMFRKLLELEGYHVDQLNNDGRSVVDEGLKYVHNDTCYPALLVIGQLIEQLSAQYPDELKGRYKLEELSEKPLETIEAIGRKRGCIVSGGVVDLEKTYKLILKEFREGVIGAISLDRLGEFEGDE